MKDLICNATDAQIPQLIFLAIGFAFATGMIFGLCWGYIINWRLIKKYNKKSKL